MWAICIISSGQDILAKRIVKMLCGASENEYISGCLLQASMSTLSSWVLRLMPDISWEYLKYINSLMSHRWEKKTSDFSYSGFLNNVWQIFGLFDLPQAHIHYNWWQNRKIAEKLTSYSESEQLGN